MINGSIEEHPEYLFDHLISVELPDFDNRHAIDPRCVAIDPFTDKIFVLLEDDEIGIGTVLIYSQSGEFVESFSSQNIRGINGMVIHKNNVYLVLGLSCLLHFKVADSMSHIASKNDGGSGIGEFMGPMQFDISNDGDLFVADLGNKRVHIQDGNLQYKRHISHHSMLKPCGVKLTPDEVYVLGYNTDCIHVFTHMGEKLRFLILDGMLFGQLFQKFCLDTSGNSIIFDASTNRINFFTKEGKVIHTFNYSGKDFGELIGTALMNNKKLVVFSLSWFHYYKLDIFSCY